MLVLALMALALALRPEFPQQASCSEAFTKRKFCRLPDLLYTMLGEARLQKGGGEVAQVLT